MGAGSAYAVLLLVISVHGLVVLRDHELQTLQQTQQLQVAGISSVLNVESERLRSVRNFAQHLIRLQMGPHAVEVDPPLQAAYAHRNDDLWQLPAPEGDAALLGVGPRLLEGMDGFYRRDEDLLPGLYVARGLSQLLSAEPVNPLVTRKLMYVSTNGFFVTYPPVPPARAAAVLRRVSNAGFMREHQPHNNPDRTLRWQIVPADDGSGDMYLTLSLPVYLHAQFRGVAISGISQRSLDAYLTNTMRKGVRSFLIDIDGHLIGASTRNVNGVEKIASVVPPSSRAATPKEMFSRGAGTLHLADGSRLMFQRIRNSNLMLVDCFSTTDLLLRAASRLSAVLAASALSLAVLLWVTLQGFRKLFSHYLARGEALRELAETDALTGLANRRVFEARFAVEHNRSLREKTPMSMLMIDIDRFKRINDHWGHASGDRVLRKLADVARAAVRAIDVPARIGGEEFAVLLPHTGIEEAAQAAERLRGILGQAVCEPAPDAAHKGEIRFTVSIGVSDLGADGTDNLDTMLMVADRRLYAAKNAGRNRVVSDDRVPEPVGDSVPAPAPTA
ncbi:diguanylate cyclase [Cupriavidus sp. AcVe19-1a]|uniref:diguanylate cyclase n=1 Tax=Cupriavidus sp. AcVe19-1a TaxID=2821359 RepID=UPI001AE0FE95|nr:diguanylate cyclase [Cupriavidus sp. AcVe19-1a]MBP0631974.1 cellulose biosynthesis regulator YedQ [Cupriavidus sp. AcVe19-1a]